MKRNGTHEFAVEATGVAFTYQEGSRALDDVDFRVKSGEFVAMLASNGSGKTTLIKLLVGLLKPDKGIVKLNGQDIRKLSRAALSRSVA